MNQSMWRGADGTVYRIVRSESVRENQARWWVDTIPDHEDVLLGPSFPERLHLLPMKMCTNPGQTPYPFAFVLP